GAQTAHRTVMGRRFLRGVPYVLPKDMDEVNRLDFQHYMMRYGLRGNYAAPVGAPDSILDVGSGTGRWAMEMADLFPHARVAGVDVAPPPENTGAGWEKPPANYSFVAGNILEGLPFADATFAFTHQRYMIGAIPRDQWPRVVGELARVTRPGGWIEVVEADTSEGGGPALRQVDAWVAAVLARRDLDIHLAARLASFLQQAGLRQVQVNNVRLPLGAYGGRVGNLVETDYFAAVQAMRTPVVALGASTAEEYDATVRAAREEVKRGKCVFPIYVVFGQRA
ncbi:MAG: methyltransferase domain-containing protein, partial [Chloroflexota bacterium]|nr:methyltransferase domain-containing protein [Chloroflexota bacterium]